MIACHINDIKLAGFKILPFNGNPELTTAISEYSHSISPCDGGLNVFGRFDVSDVECGRILITQVCNNHELIIERDNREAIRFSTHGSRFKDTQNEHSNHFKTIVVRGNRIVDYFENNLIFLDAPFLGLEADWNRVEYTIAFETWFQYSEGPENQVIPMLSFKWDLRAATERESDGWKMRDKYGTPPDEIMAAITRYGPEHQPLSIGNLPAIGEEVHKFLKHAKGSNK